MSLMPLILCLGMWMSYRLIVRACKALYRSISQ